MLISLWSASAAFAVNAVSYLGMIVVLLRWRPEHAAPPRRALWPIILDGIDYCVASREIRRVLLRGGAIGFGVAGYQALVPAVVRGPLHGSETAYGLLLALFGIGSVGAALVITPLRRWIGTEGLITLATLAFIAALMVLAGAHTLVAAAPATLIAGAGWVTGLTSINIVMQTRSPDAIIGRCLSIYQAVTFGGMALGAWFWGALADWRDLPFALHGAALWLLASLILLRLVAPMPAQAEPHQVA